ncbi:MAG: hypothetical protein DKM50_00105 [Candidatus Margulisiibacteriota bacterium]|nr:MAG: hypothetical protein A2X43_02755 [Candidatus Margulisbacteria bacterium GWD2_39_127]OGI02753.1 MAG: hypothetical protein A2X42_01790 [Candidatus Margulisbacteria bacterium GWF2_38_17]OGI09361.1 MAG: hypothetical protein A2X41_09585 [Candidatus Margulisbacteria bacterium GWE2_39_32]PZM84938.1 MAG: hypothetical protein DKM50_00105 [Candidatus Margulisiibacteriota bacterium]HAR63656.1 hypothetical protein [Candidatus Margulisiibacteriota bacterium]
MKKTKGILLVLILISTWISISFAENGGYSTTSSLDWNLFKKYNSMIFIPNQNGLLTVPIATTIGKGKIAAGLSSLEAGKISDTKVYYTNAGILLGTSDDVEIGYSKKALVFSDDYSRTDIEGANLYLKIKLLDWGDVVPRIAVGLTATSLTNESDLDKYNTFMNAFAVTSIMFDLFAARIGLHAGLENGFMGDNQGDPFFFGGATITLFDFINLCGEYVGANQEGEDGMVNASAGVKLFDILSINVNQLDLNNENNKKDPKTSAQAVLSIKFH